ncbi:MAG: hypothetical protein WDM88_05055 [Galbitalea sp.]
MLAVDVCSDSSVATGLPFAAMAGVRVTVSLGPEIRTPSLSMFFGPAAEAGAAARATVDECWLFTITTTTTATTASSTTPTTIWMRDLRAMAAAT